MKVVTSAKLSGYSLIEGFPSPDLTATITTKYLIDTLKMELCGHIESKELFPIVRIRNGIFEHPIRMYKSDKHKIVTIISDQIINPNATQDYSECIINFARKEKVRAIYTIGTLNEESTIPRIYAAANNVTGLKIIKDNKLEPIKEGMTSGISAELFLIEKKIPIILILSESSIDSGFTSSAKIIDAISRIFKIKIDSKPLREHSKLIKKNIIDNLKEQEKQIDNPKNIMYS